MFIPEFKKISNAFGIKYAKIDCETEIDLQISNVLNVSGPIICEIKMDPDQTLYPKVASMKTAEGKMISKPMEDMFPFLESTNSFLNNSDTY